MDQLKPNSQAMSGGDRSSNQSSKARLQTRKASILIIETDALEAMELCSQLSELGHRVVGVAITAASALDLALETAPDLIIANTSITAHSAVLTAVEKMRSVWPELAVVLLTENDCVAKTLGNHIHPKNRLCSGKELSKMIMKLMTA